MVTGAGGIPHDLLAILSAHSYVDPPIVMCRRVRTPQHIRVRPVKDRLCKVDDVIYFEAVN